jgi:hypothetical protein
MKKSILNFFITIFLSLVVLNAEATVFYTANLNGAAESIPNASSGLGFVTVGFDSIANTLSINATFSGLTGKDTAAHIHCCIAPPLNAAVATEVPSFIGFPLGVTSGTYNQLFDLTQVSSFNPSFLNSHGATAASAETALGVGLASGEAYFDIHSIQFPGGEIRGFFVPQVPEPENYAMMIAGLSLMGFVAHRRKNKVA